MSEKHKNASVWMSYILRHGAVKEGVQMDSAGWVKIEDLVVAAEKASTTLTASMIIDICHTDKKQRYDLFQDFKKDAALYIRANQGHSLNVDLGLTKETPPRELFHGTALEKANEITAQGIKKMARTHVHLSAELLTALEVGSRHGEPMAITINCKAMVADGIEFFKSKNGVWLVDFVDPKYFKHILTYATPK